MGPLKTFDEKAVIAKIIEIVNAEQSTLTR
jgi:hypothetical protein